MLSRLRESLSRVRRSLTPRPTTPRRHPEGERPGPPPTRAGEPTGRPSPAAASRWTGPVAFRYAPNDDGDADPGEVVWTWVPYEEDPSIGKDRPVVVVGLVEGGRLGVVPLSSKNHGTDPRWYALGSGPWDPRGRPSWVRLDFVLAVAPTAVRREGAALDRGRYDAVVAAMREGRGHG